MASATPPLIPRSIHAGRNYISPAQQHWLFGFGPSPLFILTIHLSTSDFLTATHMALQQSGKEITPPGSIINGPLTPPLTADAKTSGRVAAILRVFEGCKNGFPPSVPWTEYKLNSGEYEDLQRRLKDDGELWRYVNNKVRYVIDTIDRSLWNTEGSS